MEISQYMYISLIIIVNVFLSSTFCMEHESNVTFETIQQPINQSIVTNIEQAESLIHCAYKCQRRSSESLYFNDLNQTCYCNNDSDTNNNHHDPDESPFIYGCYSTNCKLARTTDEIQSPEKSTTESMPQTSELISPTFSSTTGPLYFTKYEDCAELREAGYVATNLYAIYIRKLDRYMHVMCFMNWDSSDGPLTVIQYRNVGSGLSFYQNWSQYVTGFGILELYGDYWIGLENIAAITNTQEYGLDIYMYPEETWHQSYPTDIKITIDKFTLDPEDNFRMTLAEPREDNNCLNGYNATYFGDGQQFSSFDQDHDQNGSINCAEMLRSAWWFKDCGFEMNGPFMNDTKDAPFMTFPPCWGSDVKLSHTQIGIFKKNSTSKSLWDIWKTGNQ